MIKNEKQYLMTKQIIQRFEASLAGFAERVNLQSKLDPQIAQLQKDSIESQLDSLRRELREYERLRSGNLRIIRCESLVELPKALIKARIARGWTHKEFAEKMEMKEEQIQRYEATEYERASFARLVDFATVLCVEVKSVMTLSELSPVPSISELTSAGLVTQSA